MGRSQWAGMGRRWRLAAVGLGMMIMVGLVLAAEDPTTTLGSGTYPAAYAIRGAKVVAAPGKVIEPGTVVVRRGVIEAVGTDKDVTVPYDAETIDGKGLVVYPGFIDLYTTRRPARRRRAVGDRSRTSGRPGRVAAGLDARSTTVAG